MNQKKGLGRGLSALFSEPDDEFDVYDNDGITVIDVDINKIEPNKSQPRKSFDEEKLNELSQSILEMGIIQPIIVKKNGEYFEIIAGERRWRAARIAGLKTVPAIVKEYTDMETLEISLIENIQRENLNPIEEAITYKRFTDEFKLNQENIAKKVGKSRVAVTNSMRLLNLDLRVQELLKQNKLSAGHARAILAIDDFDAQFEIAEKVIEEQYSVRMTENLVKKYVEAKNSDTKENLKERHNKNENAEIYKAIQKDLNDILGTKVILKNGKNKGKIEIEYYSEKELDRLIYMFKALKQNY